MNNINPCERIFQHPLPHRKKDKNNSFFCSTAVYKIFTLFQKWYYTLHTPGKSLLEDSMVTPMKSTINLLKSSPLLSFYVPFPLLNPSSPMVAQCPANWPWSDHFDDVSRLRRNLSQPPSTSSSFSFLLIPFRRQLGKEQNLGGELRSLAHLSATKELCACVMECKGIRLTAAYRMGKLERTSLYNLDNERASKGFFIYGSHFQRIIHAVFGSLTLWQLVISIEVEAFIYNIARSTGIHKR